MNHVPYYTLLSVFLFDNGCLLKCGGLVSNASRGYQHVLLSILFMKYHFIWDVFLCCIIFCFYIVCYMDSLNVFRLKQYLPSSLFILEFNKQTHHEPCNPRLTMKSGQKTSSYRDLPHPVQNLEYKNWWGVAPAFQAHPQFLRN